MSSIEQELTDGAADAFGDSGILDDWLFSAKKSFILWASRDIYFDSTSKISK